MSPTEREAVSAIIAEAFEVLTDPGQVLERYLDAMPVVYLVFDDDTLVGFQFCHEFEVDGVPVCQFSLAGKAPGRSRGVQKAIGRRVIMELIGQGNPLRRFAIAGISNNPRTYHNMLAVGGDIFPDVRFPSRPFRHTALYRAVAERLAPAGLDLKTGLVANRAASVGLKMKSEPVSERGRPLHRAFLDYVGYDLNQGVFTLAVSSAPRAVLQLIRSHAGRN